MESMFYSCKNLEYLSVTNFNISLVTSMEEMFYDCHSLTSLDLSSFGNSQVETMEYMFYNCTGLSEINLRNFKSSKLNNMKYMFMKCAKLECVNFKYFNETNSINFDRTLEDVRDNIVICIDLNNTINNFMEIIKTKRCPTIYCCDDWRDYIKEYSSTLRICEAKVFNNPGGVDYCLPETENIITTENYVENNMITTSNIITTENLGGRMEINTYIDSSKSRSFTITNKKINSNHLYETTYETSRNMIIKSNENIIISSYMLKNTINEIIENSLNINHFFIDIENNEEAYQKIIQLLKTAIIDTSSKNIVIEGMDNYIYHITTSDNVFLGGKNNSTNKFSTIDLGECENILKDHYYINRNESLIIIIFEKITNISKERTLQYEVYEPLNKTKLNLSICDNTFISVYTPVELSEEFLTLYNSLKEQGYDLFNINSSFYTDICTPFSSPNGTDVSLSDRMNYYFNNEEIQCQSNCKFSDYSVETRLLKCECDTSNSEIDTKVTKKFTEKSLYQTFYDTLKFSNYKVLKCYKLAFHINSVTINKGSIIAIIYFSIYLVFLIFFFIKGINQLKIIYVRTIMDNKRKSDGSEKENENHNEKENESKIKEHNLNKFQDKDKKSQNTESKEKQVNTKNQDDIQKSEYDNLQKTNNNIRLKKKSKTSKRKTTSGLKNIFGEPPRRKSVNKNARNVIIFSKQLSHNQLLITSKINSINHLSNAKFEEKIKFDNNDKSNNEMPEIVQEEKLDDYELNDLEFDEAIKLDKRSFIETYWSIIKREHIILFNFFVRNDYNLTFVKYSRFIFLVCTDMALNVFFFADETMHKMFLDYGKYNFIQQIPQIVYSTIVSQLIEVFLCFLSLTDKYYYEIKNLEYSSRFEVIKIIKIIKKKLVGYFIFTFLMFAFYWYAIACFCAVYANTQAAFITDSLSSFGLGLLYPFILYLFPSALRLIALKVTNSRLTFFYTLSDIIPFF